MSNTMSNSTTKKRRSRRQALTDKTKKDPAHMVEKYLSLHGKYMRKSQKPKGTGR